jgi:isoleucyl-tRNA synthetase
MIEKELGLNSKKDIEVFGVEKFNEACRASVLRFGEEWKKTIRRMGRWVDMENDYKTMDTPYMESVWWVFSELWKKDLIYQGYKPMHICPRCVTPLSQNEVTEGYKDVKDISVIVKFKIATPKPQLLAKLAPPNELDRKYISEHDVYILAWTTTPWTLPGNVLLAVNFICKTSDFFIGIIDNFLTRRVSDVTIRCNSLKIGHSCL